MEWVAEKKYAYMVLPTLAPFELRRQAAEYFSACCEKAGYTVRHSQIGWGIGIYVGETDEEARRELRTALLVLRAQPIEDDAAAGLAARTHVAFERHGNDAATASVTPEQPLYLGRGG